MKKIFIALSILFIAFSYRVFAEEEKPTITIKSEGTVEVEPNVAFLVFGIASKATSCSEALAENSSAYESVMKYFKTEKKLKDFELTVFPIKVSSAVKSSRRHQETGFAVERWFIAKKENISKSDIDGFLQDMVKVIDQLAQKGVNLWGLERSGALKDKMIYYGIEDIEKYENKAKEIAYNNLEKMKQSESKTYGLRLGKLKNISSSTRILSRRNYPSFGMDIFKNGYITADYEPIKIQGTVRAVYEIEK